jgi:hypothetical protein
MNIRGLWQTAKVFGVEKSFIKFTAMENVTRKEETPKWLRRAQEGSWEPEILISGIVLLALTQVPRLLDQLHYWLEERTSTFYFYTSEGDDILFSILKVSSYWLIAGLITHLVMRSVWVSFVGLSYVYPNGIKFDNLKYQPSFQRKMEALPSFEASVEKLENICSSIYSIAFLLVMATISACLYMVFIIFLALMLSFVIPANITDNGGMDDILSVVTLFIAIPYFIDFLTLGGLKRIRFIRKIYGPIYTVMSFITFSHVYRGIYYGLVTNLNRNILRVAIVIFSGLSLYFVIVMNDNSYRTSDLMSKSLETATYAGYYRDVESDRYSTWAHIQSAVVSEGVVELFLPHKVQYEEVMLEACEANRAAMNDTVAIEAESKNNLACMRAYYNIYIDGARVEPGRFYMTELSQTGQFGLLTWVGVEDLENGQHYLEVAVNHPRDPDRMVAHIPFYKAGMIIDN